MYKNCWFLNGYVLRIKNTILWHHDNLKKKKKIQKKSISKKNHISLNKINEWDRGNGYNFFIRKECASKLTGSELVKERSRVKKMSAFNNSGSKQWTHFSLHIWCFFFFVFDVCLVILFSSHRPLFPSRSVGNSHFFLLFVRFYAIICERKHILYIFSQNT